MAEGGEQLPPTSGEGDDRPPHPPVSPSIQDRMRGIFSHRNRSHSRERRREQNEEDRISIVGSETGNDDDGERGVDLMSSLHEHKAVDFRHHEIGQDCVERRRRKREKMKRLCRMLSGLNFESFDLNQDFDLCEADRVVVNMQDATVGIWR